MTKRAKKITQIVYMLIATLIIVSELALSILVGYAMTHRERKELFFNPSDFDLPYKDVKIMSKDGITSLNGWVIEPTDPKKTIIMSHGYAGNRHESYFLRLSKALYDNGYRIVLFDFRASGESEGDTITVGIKEQLDLHGAIEWVDSNYREDIVLYGASMGASTSILAGSDKRVSGIIADSPYSDLKTYLKDNLSTWTGLPEQPFNFLIINLMPIILNIDPSEASPIKTVKDIKSPVLFIHGMLDSSIPYSESEKMVKETKNAELWLIEGVGHVEGYKLKTEEYTNKVLKFLEEI